MTITTSLQPPEVIPVALLGAVMVTAPNVRDNVPTNIKTVEVAAATSLNPPVQQEKPANVQEPSRVQEAPRAAPKPVPQRTQNSQRKPPERRVESPTQASREVQDINAATPRQVEPAVQSTAASNTTNRGTQATSSAGVQANQASATPSAAQGNPNGSAQTVTEPSYHAAHLNNRQPVYPTMSRKLGEEGRVILHVLIAANGSVQQINIKASSGFKRLDESALSAVKKWRFVPAKRGDVPMEMWYDVPINFSLNG